VASATLELCTVPYLPFGAGSCYTARCWGE